MVQKLEHMYQFELEPSKHLLVLRTSSKRLHRNNIMDSKTLWRRLARISWKRPEDLLKTSCKMSWRRLEDMPWRGLQDLSCRCLADVLRMSCRYLEDIMEITKAEYLLGISVSYKYKCVPNKSIFHKSISENSKTNPKCIN